MAGGRPKNCGRCRKPKTQCKCGRPTVMTPETLEKLKEAFLMDCTDIEACLMAEISVDALYKYQRENPEYIKEKEKYKANPFLVARTSVIKNMQEDGNLALKYLERKKKDEFSTRQEQTGADGKPLESVKVTVVDERNTRNTDT